MNTNISAQYETDYETGNSLVVNVGGQDIEIVGTPGCNESELRVVYERVADGEVFISVSRGLNSAVGDLAQLRLALNTFYSMIGCRVISIQIEMEQVERMLSGSRPREKLRLIYGSKP